PTPMNGCTSPLEPTGVKRKCATMLAGKWCRRRPRRAAMIVGHGPIESRRKFGKARCRAHPAQGLDVIEQRYIGSQRGEGAEQKRAIALAGEGPSQCAR